MSQTPEQVGETRALDAKVAELVMGWKRVQPPKWDYDGPLPQQGEVLVPPWWNPDGYAWPNKGVVPFDNFVGFYDLSKFSTDPAAAWQVVEKMRELGFLVKLQSYDSQPNPAFIWGCRICSWTRDGVGDVIETSMPLAVCRAALAAAQSAGGGEGKA